jgi:hypothetical protein
MANSFAVLPVPVLNHINPTHAGIVQFLKALILCAPQGSNNLKYFQEIYQRVASVTIRQADVAVKL